MVRVMERQARVFQLKGVSTCRASQGTPSKQEPCLQPVLVLKSLLSEEQGTTEDLSKRNRKRVKVHSQAE